MTIEEVVKRVLPQKQSDVLRAAVEAVCAELMEIEVAQQIGAERGERRPEDRMTHRSGAVSGSRPRAAFSAAAAG
jgi:putative transposase